MSFRIGPDPPGLTPSSWGLERLLSINVQADAWTSRPSFCCQNHLAQAESGPKLAIAVFFDPQGRIQMAGTLEYKKDTLQDARTS